MNIKRWGKKSAVTLAGVAFALAGLTGAAGASSTEVGTHVASGSCLKAGTDSFGGPVKAGSFGAKDQVCYLLRVGPKTHLLVSSEVLGQYGYDPKAEAQVSVAGAGGSVTGCSAPIEGTQYCTASGTVRVLITKHQFDTYGVWFYDLSHPRGCTKVTSLNPSVSLGGKVSLGGQESCFAVATDGAKKLGILSWPAGASPGVGGANGVVINSSSGRVECSYSEYCTVNGNSLVLLTSTVGYQAYGSFAEAFFTPSSCRRVVVSTKGSDFSWAPSQAHDPLCFSVTGAKTFKILTNTDLTNVNVYGSNGNREPGVGAPTGMFMARCYPIRGSAVVSLFDQSPYPTRASQPWFVNIEAC